MLRHMAAAAQPDGGQQQQQQQQGSTGQEHAALQAEYFQGSADAIQGSITPAVDAKLARLAAAIPGLSSGSRVLDAGAGTGALIPHLQVHLPVYQQRALNANVCYAKCRICSMAARSLGTGFLGFAAACHLCRSSSYTIDPPTRLVACATSWRWTSPPPWLMS
jgi:hypothetical protein